MSRLAAITRPNGKTYNARKIAAHVVTEDDGDERVVVLGTHDIERARMLANRLVVAHLDSRYEVDNPWLVWWRDGMDHGQRRWIDDDVRGRPGVFFAGLVEVAEVSA